MLVNSYLARAQRTRLGPSKYERRYAFESSILFRQKSTSIPTRLIDTSSIPKNSRPHRWLFISLGIGLTTAFTIHSFSLYTIYGDAQHNAPEHAKKDETQGGKLFSPYDFETVVKANGDKNIQFNPSPGIRRRDAFQLGSNFPIEDAIIFIEWDYSPSLTWSSVTILDGHNSARLTEFLGRALSSSVFNWISDVYSKHAALADHSKGYDLLDGRQMDFGFEHGNPGDPPRSDPFPPGEELDSAIRRAFVLTDEFIVHETARKVLGLTREQYAAFRSSWGEGARRADKDSAKKQPASSSKMGRIEALQTLKYPYAGSCAIMGLFNPQDRSLRVALTGDSRAVYGRRVPAAPSDPTSQNRDRQYTYQATQLTLEQNFANPVELTRVTSQRDQRQTEHQPFQFSNSESNALGVVSPGSRRPRPTFTRAFGDGPLKWPLPIQHQLQERYFGPSGMIREEGEVGLPPYPYLTAEPVVTMWKGEGGVERGDFVVFGSTGFLECLGSEEAIGLVGLWLEEKGIREIAVKEKENGRNSASAKKEKEILFPPLARPSQPSISSSPAVSSLKTYLPTELPALLPTSYLDSDSTTRYRQWGAEKKFVCEDSDANVAVHLVRNALGGANKDLRDALTGLDVGICRQFRDDISVVVVFFD